MGKVRSKHISFVILGFLVAIASLLVWKFLDTYGPQEFVLDRVFLQFCIVGFLAQILDGSVGMGYGVSCTTFLLHLGVPPAIASASVHTAAVFTTGASGLSHLYFKNVDKRLFFRLVVPGAIGAALGAYLLSEIFDGAVIKPFIAGYLLILGVVILVKSFGLPEFQEEVKRVSPLGFIGGLLAAMGGGGWGPIVTSNLIHKGKTPQLSIGTVNTAEFFVSFFGAGMFLFFLGLEGWKTILGLMAGGVIAAPLGGLFVRFVKPRFLMFFVGLLIIVTSTFTIIKSLT